MSGTNNKFMAGLEGKIASWLKPLPRLPISAQKWIAANIWWLTLISVILSAIAALAVISALITAMSFVGVTTGYYYYNGAYTGLWVANSIVSLVFWVAVIVVGAVAVKPLRQMKKSGWNLLFLMFLIGIVSSLVSQFFTFNPFTFIFGLVFMAIFAAISAYFLFEIRSQFLATTKK